MLYEDLADKTIQWEPTLEEFRTNDPSFSKRGAYSIETNIGTEAKLAAVMGSVTVPVKNFRLTTIISYNPSVGPIKIQYFHY